MLSGSQKVLMSCCSLGRVLLSLRALLCAHGGGGRCLSKYLQNFLFSNNLF